ncbi:Type I Iterative Polyketide synthase (PKS) [Aspergillus melleus]|uniref:Type I Iterative Polyketide synthase (PKS) n=1 Tax=Aspergillus melleus TaxID=138277 RepID=A0ACC3BBP9_9EURO|nr:Type I Iterative Polyketide synthase (PKS) [Aspergillus melleus]
MNLEAFVHRNSKGFVKGAHFMKEDPALFDASFFGIGGTEATAMDPQHRLVLETSYRALENAGIPMESANGSKTAVYSGCMTDDYRHLVCHDAESIPKYAAVGSTMSMLANRLSWFFNLTGPCVNLDSACSSSLMALDMACQGLRNGDSNMALIAGANLIVGVEAVVSLMNMSFVSPDGRCYSFDERANGYGRGEGCGVIVIKRLSDAINDGNVIRAVIRSTGSNQDGYTPGLTQPSRALQARLIRECYAKAGLDFAPTRFFEAHGTGTAVGDPIEADAIGSIFRTSRSPDDPLYIGAVKSNIGHLEGGSGIAGIIKTVLVLEKGIIPPISSNFERLNPQIDVEFLNIKIPTESIPWPAHGLRRASVNSFGFGGSNAHVVLDDAYHFLKERGLHAAHCSVAGPPSLNSDGHVAHLSKGQLEINGSHCRDEPHAGDKPETNSLINGQTKGHINGHTNDHVNGFTNGNAAKEPAPQSQLLVFSADDEAGIERIAESYGRFFETVAVNAEDQTAILGRLAETLATKRSRLSWRAFAVADEVKGLKNLKSIISNSVQAVTTPTLGYIFTDLLTQADATTFDINDPEYAQPLTTALQISLVNLLSSLGLSPTKVVGHSSGEIAAASYAAGALSLVSACKVSYFRGVYASRLRRENDTGGMMAVPLSHDTAQPYLDDVMSRATTGGIYVACINSPDNVTISGHSDLLNQLQVLLDADNIRYRRLRTGVAYHTPQMRAIADAYEKSLQGLQAESPSRKTSFLSSVTGSAITDLGILYTPAYWVRNMVESVNFSGAITTGLSQPQNTKARKLGATGKQGVTEWLEVGPHGALQRPFREISRASTGNTTVRYASTLDRRMGSISAFQTAMGTLHSVGHSISITDVNQTSQLPLKQEHTNLLINLPAYPFNHSRRYWYETQETRNVRLRSHRRTELLGAPTPESHPGETRWRTFFDAAQMPWVLDHAVNSKPIYPATGMIVMAIEGAARLADPTREKSGYYLHDATFTHPIVIDAAGRTQADVYMRAIRQNQDKSSHSFEFRIYVPVGGQWTEACRGVMSVQYAGSSGEGEWDIARRQAKLDSQYHMERLNDTKARSQLSVPTDRMYQTLRDNGLHYGPAFQVMQNLSWDGKTDAAGDIKVFEWNKEQSQQTREEHVVHPATLDGLGQLGLVALTNGGEKMVTTGLASTRVRKAWIAASGASSPSTSTLKAYARSKFKGLRGTDTHVVALDESGDLKVWITSMETTSMSANNASPTEKQAKQLCGTVEWQPSLGMMTKEQLRTWCDVPSQVEEPVAFFDQLEVLLLASVRQVIQRLDEKLILSMPSHLQKYVVWLKWQLKRYDLGVASTAIQHPLIESPNNVGLAEQLGNDIKYLSSEGNLPVLAAQNMQGVISGAVDPLDLLYHDDLAAHHYQIVCDRMLRPGHLHRYLKTLAHEKPGLNVLEIGAGTGSVTGHILEALATEQGSRVARYDYTDISESLFANARERFSTHGSKINFHALNIEASPEEQGFELGSYDLIVGAWVLHATTDLESATRNVRQLLKPGGKLVLLEVTNPDILRNSFIFGTLPGWWMGKEPYREHGACVSEEKWAEILGANGFNGLDLSFPDYKNKRCQEHSVLIATASGADPLRLLGEKRKRIVCVVNPESKLQAQIVAEIRARNEKHTVAVESLPLESINQVDLKDSPLVVFLPEIEASILAELPEATFKQLHGFLCQAQDVIWVTASSQTDRMSPRAYMIEGLAKVLCTENDRLSFVTLGLEDHVDDPDALLRHIDILILKRQATRAKDEEIEYREKNGLLHIGRAVEEPLRNDRLFEQTQAPTKWRPFQQRVPLTLSLTNPGFLDASSMVFVEDMEYTRDLSSTEIEIEVKSFGINFRDVFVMLGKLSDGDTLGCECAGIVKRVGSNCKDIRVGDFVCAAILGCVPALPIPGVTAYHSLVNLARLEKDETVLIHSGAGGTGQMAIQVAQSIGAEVFVTVGSQDKASFLQMKYNIPEDHILYSRDTTFSRHIQRMTDNRGVNVILNSLSGDGLIASWECIAPYGRFVELGKADVDGNSKLPMINFAKNVSFFLVAVDHMCRDRPALIQSSLGPVMDMLQVGTLHAPWPLQQFPLSSLEEALRLMQSGKHTGKLIIDVEPQHIVSLPHVPSYTFPSDATYVIAGGLGGLGRSAAQWMASMGAKNLILLSRSGPRTDAALQLIGKLASQGVSVRAPKCDVAGADALSTALEQCRDMPPIKGCLQATMVLQDAIFEMLTFKQWETTIRSKVQSTENLHTVLPSGLDFFIMLSSLAGVVGTVSQANYAAGNTFQDAFARYRRSIGQHATAVDLGRMGEVGVIAENAQYSRHQENVPVMEDISEKEFHSILEQCCQPPIAPHTDGLAESDQVLVGLVSPAQLRAQHVDVPVWMTERALFRALPQDPTDQFDATLATTDPTAAVATSAGHWHAIFMKTDPGDAPSVVINGLTQKLGHALDVPAGDIDTQRSLALQGVDSLLAVELRQ